MSRRRRFHVMQTCEACGRVLADAQLATHERTCTAWKRDHDQPEGETSPAAPGAPAGPPEADK